MGLYAPTGMPDHSCCDVPLIAGLHCLGIPGKPTSLLIDGTGPYCCPAGATETAPCASVVSTGLIVLAFLVDCVCSWFSNTAFDPFCRVSREALLLQPKY